MEYIIITDDGKEKTSEIIERLRKKFGFRIEFLGENSQKDKLNIDSDVPPPANTTSRKFRFTVDTDPEHMEKSAEDAWEECLNCITCREYLFLAEAFFDQTGKYLDPKGWTNCAGTCRRDGKVPFIWSYASDRKVYILWHRPDHSHSFEGLRVEVE